MTLEVGEHNQSVTLKIGFGEHIVNVVNNGRTVPHVIYA